MRRGFLLLLFLLAANTCLAAWTERYVTTTGAGTNSGADEANAFTLAQAITDSATAADGTRYNVKNGTYTLAGDTNFNGAGSSAGAIWWRGYNTTIGDIDSDNTLTKPLIDAQTNFTTISGAFQWFSNIRFTGASVTAAEGGGARVTGPDCRIWRCRFSGTAADSDCRGLDTASTCDRLVIFGCYFEANAAAHCALILDDASLHGCVFSGGLSGLAATGGPVICTNSLFINQAANGVNNASADMMVVTGNTFYNQASDCIEATAASNTTFAANNVFVDAGDYAINSSAGTSAAIALLNNSYYSNASGDLFQIHESFQLGNVTEASSPFTNAGTGNFSITAGALSISAGYPGTLENNANIGYPDIGALQRQPSGSNTIDPLTGTIPGL